MYDVLDLSDRLSNDPTPEEINSRIEEVQRDRDARARARRIATHRRRSIKQTLRSGGVRARRVHLEERPLTSGNWRTLPAGTTGDRYHGQ